MEMNQISLTAMMTAYIRAYHSKYVTPKIFDDFLAYSFIPVERRALIEQGLADSLKLQNPLLYDTCQEQAEALSLVMQTITGPPNVLSRSRFTEDILLKAISQGVNQYVILGAGMDTFAFRHSQLLKEIHVFEVDQFGMQEFKRQRIADLAWTVPSHLHFVPVDFTQNNLASSLKTASYKPNTSSFFSWLGVTMYLSREEVFSTLQDISNNTSSGSIIIFDYLDPDAFIPEKAAARVQGMLQMAQYAGEPMKTSLEPSILASDLAALGIHLQENLCPNEIEKRYFQGRSDGYYTCEHVHFALAVVE
ncbi:MAG: SAM-dependent methyltransferase [Firmicutes bacterium HGW-Firmicutes-12]|jgi:methyltransferase (TIGR00027 family)|nr:MAG: SAM-dependent methyltransferase [Firmicutes bacterium HGW-Firmicutes-12]